MTRPGYRAMTSKPREAVTVDYADLVFDSQAATLLIRDLQAAIAVLLRISINQQNLDSDLDLADWQAVEILLQAPAMGYESEMHSPNDLDHTDGGQEKS